MLVTDNGALRLAAEPATRPSQFDLEQVFYHHIARSSPFNRGLGALRQRLTGGGGGGGEGK